MIHVPDGEPADISEDDNIHRDQVSTDLTPPTTPDALEPSMYYDRQGRPIDMWQWSAHTEDNEYRTIGRDTLTGPKGDGYLISTVWIGITHRVLTPGVPMGIFETMAFDPDRNSLGQLVHDTEEQARAWHEKLVQALRDGIPIGEIEA